MAEKQYFARDVGAVSESFGDADPGYVEASVDRNPRAVNRVKPGDHAALAAMSAEHELTPSGSRPPPCHPPWQASWARPAK